MSYAVYGENLETTLKLLTCLNSINLIDKKEGRLAKRMTLNAHCQTLYRSRKHMKVIKEELKTIKPYKPHAI